MAGKSKTSKTEVSDMDDGIDRFLDADGRAVMTGELWDIFVGGGCRPQCHICGNSIEVSWHFRLKPFATVTRGEDEVEVAVMVCDTCDRKERKLDRQDAERVVYLAHGDEHPVEMRRSVVKPTPPHTGGCFLVRGGGGSKIVV